MTTARDRLEGDLRDAAHDFDDVVASPQAWQDNQRRLVGSRSRRSRLVLGGAAAVAVLAVAGGATLRGGSTADVPAAGGDDPFATANLLGEPVELETVTFNSAPVVHEAALSDRTGEGPQLCDRYVGVTDTPVCTNWAEGAEDPKVAVDWLTAYGPESPRRGVVVGVDRRVSFLDIWLTDGSRVNATLRPGGWDGSQLTGLTMPAGDPGPQRLVAYGRDGNVLQSVDLVARFGDGWLEQHSACGGDPVAKQPPDGLVPGTTLPWAEWALGTTDAYVTVRLTAGGTEELCLPRLRASAIAAHATVGGLAIAVLAPETELVRVQVGDRTLTEVTPVTAAGSLWRVAVLGEADLSRALLVAYDKHGLELDRAYVNQPPTP